MSTPQTTIYLCSDVPLNNRYDHTFYFPNHTIQDAYFHSKVMRKFSAYSYVRKTWKLKVEATMENARVWSYLYFKNGTGKTYYYFINQIEYINDNTVELSLEIDVLQTYMFDWELRPCYVEREHSESDEWGENTIDEGLDGGELITKKVDTINLSNNLVIMTASSIDINKFYNSQGEEEDKICGAYYDKIYGGFEITATPTDNIYSFTVMLNYLNTKGKIDSIFNMWMYPAELITSDYGDYEFCVAPYVTGVQSIGKTASSRPTSIDGYTPKNNKVLQYPYCFMYATNNNGGAAVYHYERFKDEKLEFQVNGNIAPDAVVKLIPCAYKGVNLNYDEALTLGSFPMCAWNSDSYKMWLAQNQNQQNLSTGTSVLKIIGGVGAIAGGIIGTVASSGSASPVAVGAITAGGGMLTSGISDIASQLSQKADKEVQPPQSKGNYAGSHNLSRGIHNFEIHHKTIDAYHAEVIDNFFSMYGYACRKVKTPNICARPRWSYVKTINSNIGGNICMDDLKIINAIFDKGVTFWRNDEGTNINLGNYHYDNSV